MGATPFEYTGDGKSAEEAFLNARDEALFDHGHAGYTGTLAEKNDYIMVALPEGEDAYAYAARLIEEGDERIDDKWGPAGCIELGGGRILFFGWAPS